MHRAGAFVSAVYRSHRAVDRRPKMCDLLRSWRLCIVFFGTFAMPQSEREVGSVGDLS